jgi:hypothetical protein
MQVHYELAKCEEQSDFVAIAKEEGTNSLNCDYGTLEHAKQSSDGTGLDKNRSMDLIIKPFVELLDLRSNVFDSPDDVEGKVLLWLQQAKDSKSKEFISDMLIRSIFVMLEEIKGGESKSETKSDISLRVMNVKTLVIPEIPLDQIGKIVKVSRTRASVMYQSFSDIIFKRITIMVAIAKLAHAIKEVNILQNAASYVLSFTWDYQDKFLYNLIDDQILLHNLLADSLLERMTRIPAILQDIPRGKENSIASSDLIDSRCLGLKSDNSSEDVNMIKRLIIACLERGMMLSMNVKSIVGIQNAMIYFWNMHLHIFRNRQYMQISDEAIEFLKLAISLFDQIKALSPTSSDTRTNFDERLKVSYFEALCEYYEFTQQIPLAIEFATKGCYSTGSEYVRKKLCEQVPRYYLLIIFTI